MNFVCDSSVALLAFLQELQDDVLFHDRVSKDIGLSTLLYFLGGNH